MASPPQTRRPLARIRRLSGRWETSRDPPGAGAKEVSYAHRVNTAAMSPDQVLCASAEWISVWFPAHSVHTDLGWLEYYLLDGTATVMRVRPGDTTAAEFVNGVLTELGRQSTTQVHWQTGPGSSPTGVDQVLTGLGASVHETIDICAYSLDRAFQIGSHTPGVSVRPVRSRDDVAQFERPARKPGATPLLPRKTLTGPSRARQRATSSAAGAGCPQVPEAIPWSEMSPASGEQR